MNIRSSLMSLALITSMTSLGAATASAAELHASATITSDVVTLGDLFDNAGDASNVIIAQAPAPGDTSEISVSRISLAARRNGLAWYNTTGLSHVSVTRNGLAVPDTEVSNAISAAIIDKSPSFLSNTTLQVDFANGNAGIEVGEKDAQTVTVEKIAFNPRNGAFEALLRAPANDPSAPLHRVSGRAYPVAEIPVLTHNVAPGEIVRAGDVQWVRLPSTRVSTNIITTEAGLVGMSPRYPVRSGEPIRTSDLQQPIVVAKGAMVDMNYVSGTLTLIARGRAVTSGAIGDTIDIINPRSNRTVQGVIEGPNTVRIDTMSTSRAQTLSMQQTTNVKS